MTERCITKKWLPTAKCVQNSHLIKIIILGLQLLPLPSYLPFYFHWDAGINVIHIHTMQLSKNTSAITFNLATIL